MKSPFCARLVAGIAALGCGALWAAPAGAALLDTSFVETPYAAAGAAITGMAWAPDGSKRLFLTNKAGAVRIVVDGALIATPFWNFPDVFTTSECGLLGIAFDPLFSQNGWIYFFVTVSASEQQIIRLTATGNTGGEPTVIVPGLPTLGRNHDGGALGFGPDGKLYWAIGDNGSGIGVDGDLTLLAAKVGRANKDGTVPLDNPFVDGDGPNNDFIWARGFRNPFTFTWQPTHETLWVNVVGTSYEQIFEVKAGEHAGYNAYESNQPEGFLQPKIVYRTDASWERNLRAASGAHRAGGVTTFTTNADHRMRLGHPVVITGVADTSFNGPVFISSVPTARSFTAEQAGPDAASGGGVATNPEFGGCVTGGEFLDSSSAPADYRGNFFFGDFNSGRIGRVVLDPTNAVRKFDVFGEGVVQPIDFAVGPDGDLYYVTYDGTVYRARYGASAQGLVVSHLNTRLAEGGSFWLGVRLASAPAGAVQVRAEHDSGDADVTTTAPVLSFGPGNWDVPQMVEVKAAHDLDSVDDAARLLVRSAGLTTERVNVRVTDDDAPSLVLSTDAITLDEAGGTSFDVALSGPPSGPLTVAVELALGDEDIVVIDAELAFDASSWSTAQTVRVEAAPDADIEDDAGTLRVSAAGFGEREIAVTVLDDDGDEPPPEPSAGAGGMGGESAIGSAGEPAVAAGSGGVVGSEAGAGGAPSAPSGGAPVAPTAGTTARGGQPASSGAGPGSGADGNEGAGAGGTDGDAADSDSGCGCRAAPSNAGSVWLLALALLGLGRARRRRR